MTIKNRSKLTTDDINFANRMVKYYIQETKSLCEKLLRDPDRSRREKAFECKKCYYQGKIAGQTFTNYSCRICEKEDTYPNTAVPKLCLECSKEKQLCRDCGASLDGKDRKEL